MELSREYNYAMYNMYRSAESGPNAASHLLLMRCKSSTTNKTIVSRDSKSNFNQGLKKAFKSTGWCVGLTMTT